MTLALEAVTRHRRSGATVAAFGFAMQVVGGEPVGVRRKAHVEPTRKNGMHALRHHYASVLLNDGVSIRALADCLVHADPGFTLRVYCHLMPDSEDRARQAVDAALGCEPDVSQEAADEAFPQVRPLRDQMS